jgi:hypothetical protein
MRLNLNPHARNKHEEFLVNMFSKDVHVITEYKDGAVWKTKKVGTVVCNMKDAPINPKVKVRIVPK